MRVEQELIVVEQELPHPRGRVWRALTTPAEMPRWFFPEIETFDPTPGSETSFLVVNEGREFDHRWQVREAEQGARLVLGWRYQGHPGDSVVTFELEDAGDGTRIRVTHRVTEDFPAGVPEFTREACEGGWVYFLQESLPAYLAGAPG